MTTMRVSLPKTMADFVEDLVADGSYASSSEVFGDALRLLHREKTATLRREVATGLDDAVAGRFSDRSVSEIAESVLRATVRR